MGNHLAKLRESLRKGDRVFVVGRPDKSGNIPSRRGATVVEVMRGAARVLLDGDHQPKVIRFASIDISNYDGDPVLREDAKVPHLVVTEELHLCDEPGCESEAHRRGKCRDHQHLLYKSGRARANRESREEVEVKVEEPGTVDATRAPPAHTPPHANIDPPSSFVPPTGELSPRSDGARARAREKVEPIGGEDFDRVGGVLTHGSLDDLIGEARYLLDLRRPIVRRLEARLTELLAARRELNGQITKVESILDQLNADSVYDPDAEGDPEAAEPYDKERIARYLGHIDEVLNTGPATWNEIRAFVLEQHPGVDTRLLGSALSNGKNQGRYEHDGKRGGLWSLVQ